MKRNLIPEIVEEPLEIIASDQDDDDDDDDEDDDEDDDDSYGVNVIPVDESEYAIDQISESDSNEMSDSGVLSLKSEKSKSGKKCNCIC